MNEDEQPAPSATPHATKSRPISTPEPANIKDRVVVLVSLASGAAIGACLTAVVGVVVYSITRDSLRENENSKTADKGGDA